jgi:YD repeat-containing protein
MKEVSQPTTSDTGNPAANENQSSETIYAYEYDAYGNWTVKKTSSRTLPDGTFKDVGDEIHRTIEYF